MTPFVQEPSLGSLPSEPISRSGAPRGPDDDSFVARVLHVLRSFDYCFLRDGEDVDALRDAQEWDLLIAPAQRERLTAELGRLGFLRMPSLGYEPHTFLLGYDERSDRWLKLDLVDRIAFGHRYALFATQLGPHLLETRLEVDGRYVPCEELELICLLLHGLLDKQSISTERRHRLETLAARRAASQTWDTRWVAVTAADQSIRQMLDVTLADIRSHRWEAVESRRGAWKSAFLAMQKRAATARQRKQQILRRASRMIAWASPRLPSIALLAPDGAGKSSLITRLEQQIAWPVKTVYMGLYQKPSHASSPSHVSSPAGSPPAKDTDTPISLSKSRGAKTTRFPTLLLRTWKKYLHARHDQACHQFILFDRYPTDARLPQQPRRSVLKRLRRWLLGHSCPLPDLTIILDAPGEVLYARKHEHSIVWLEQQRQNYLELAQRVPRTIVIDANRSLECVQRDLSRTTWELLRTKLGRTQR